jgi:protease IV
MKVNRLISDLSKGQWAMSLEGLCFWAGQANRILLGEKINFNLKAKKLIDFFDDNNYLIKPDEKGFVEIPEGSIAVLNMIGPIVKYGDYCSYGSDEIVDQLERLDKNPNIKAILVYMDGPGGGVSAIAPFMQFGEKRNKKKPLGVVYEQCCSAHLYIAKGLQPDFVWAENNISSVIGSLGVMLSYLDDQKYMEQMGLKMVSIYPDESPDKNLPIRLALEGKFDLIKTEMLSPLARRFQTDIIRLDPNLKIEVPGVLTGKVFYSDDAVAVGFANKIGSLSEALQYITTLSELNHYNSNY